jgi:hypothetical protein
MAAAVGRMGPGEAAPAAAQAARTLTEMLEKETRAGNHPELVENLVAVAERLSPEEASQIYRLALRRLLQTARAPNDPWGNDAGTYRALSNLFSRLNDADVAPLIRELAHRLCSRRDANETVLGEADASLDALLSASSPLEARRRTVTAATAWGLSAATPLHALAALPAAAEPPPCRLSTQDLVELLKMPTCWGKARRVVLKHLGNRYGRTFANHWQFVRFARERQFDLDFTTPPRRWQRD